MKIISIVLYFLSFPVIAANYWLTEVSERELVADFSTFDIPEGSYTKAALKAFYGRDWNVESINDNVITGRLFYKDGYSRVKIDMSEKPKINIKYIDKNLTINTSYLHNLGRDMLVWSLTCN